jgi:hypothetical protein
MIGATIWIVVFSRRCVSEVLQALDELAHDCPRCSAAALDDCQALQCPLRRVVLECRA